MSEEIEGVFKKTKKGAGELRQFKRSFRASPEDIYVPAKLVKEYQLENGANICGMTSGKLNRRKLMSVESICGIKPEDFASRKNYKDLTSIIPTERFNLEAGGKESMRIVDLVAPIGRGTRGLIVAPPKSGKTMLLASICEGIRADCPDADIIVLLIDERPEEVTEFRREVDAEVLHSSLDNSIKEHTELVELTLAHIMVELECGKNIVVLVDSLTRMGRSFNLSGKGSGRTMSGGVDAGSLEIPRRFFGMARNIEDGGSVTIIATALIDTGSRMDNLIFEEFKGTGNSEIILDRKLAEERIWPAINLPESGTRNETKLFGDDDTKRLAKLRKALASRSTKEAITAIMTRIEKYPTNREFLDSIPI